MTYDHDEPLLHNMAEYIMELFKRGLPGRERNGFTANEFLPQAKELLEMVRDNVSLMALVYGEDAYRKERPGSGAHGQDMRASYVQHSRRFAAGWKEALDYEIKEGETWPWKT